MAEFDFEGEGDIGGGAIGGLISGALSIGLGVVGTILGSLLNNLIFGNPTQKLADALNSLATAMSQAIDILKRAIWTVARALGALLATIEHLLVDFLTRIWAMVKDIAQALGKLVKSTLPAIAKAIAKAREVLQDIYKRFIRPILNWIQIARRYLVILRALHIPFADKLDKILTRIESRIIGPYLYVLRALNGVGTWVNAIVTAAGVIQRAVFLRTMYAYQDDWVNMWWASQVAPPVQGTAAPPPVAVVPLSNAQVQSNWDVYAASGSGPMAAVIAQSFQYGDQAQAA